MLIRHDCAIQRDCALLGSGPAEAGEAEAFTKRLVFHRYRLTDPADLDADFAGLIAEALAPPPPP